MDSENLVPTDELKEACQNDNDHQHQEDGAVPVDGNSTIDTANDIHGPNGSVETTNKLESEANDFSTMEGADISDDYVVCDVLNSSKDEVGKDDTDAKQSELKTEQGKCKSELTSGQRRAATIQVKKNKNGKDGGAASLVSHGSTVIHPHPKQPLRSKSFNVKQSQSFKRSGKSDPPSSEPPRERVKSQPIRKVPPAKAGGDLTRKAPPANAQGESIRKVPLPKAKGEIDSLLSPKSGDSNPQRIGKLPNYSFNFKCNERAEKRKEFYTKIEEKILAKEVEKTNLQAKSKESHDAEVKKLRKSLNFKATPMPSFYQEPPPPKMELKKIPTTRAKSPKLGRRKSSSTVEAEVNSQTSQLGRLSLGGKVSENNQTKGVSPVHPKKPQRKSLPSKLPSEKIKVSSAVNGETKSVKATDKQKKSAAASPIDGEKSPSITVVSQTASAIKDCGAIPMDDTNELGSHTDKGVAVEEQIHIQPLASEL